MYKKTTNKDRVLSQIDFVIGEMKFAIETTKDVPDESYFGTTSTLKDRVCRINSRCAALGRIIVSIHATPPALQYSSRTSSMTIQMTSGS